MDKFWNITSFYNAIVFKTIYIITMLAIISPASLLIFSNPANAAPYLNNRSLKISSSTPGKNDVLYEYSFDVPNIATLGSVKLSLCSNSPLPEVPCTGFTGSGLSTSNLSSQTGTSGFSIMPNPTQTEVILTRVPALQSSGLITLSLNNIVNPSDAGTYYGRIELFSSNNASGTAIYEGGTAISINNPVGISTEVPPYLYFCVAIQITGLDCSNTDGVFKDMGELSANLTKTAQSQFLTATNASSGYNVSYLGSELTSGNNIINSIGILTTSQTGKSQFGINLRKNNTVDVGVEPSGMPPNPVISNNYNTPDKYSFKSGETLVSINEPSYFNKFTVSYIVNIDKNQKPGIYSTTLTYLCLANF